MVAVEIHGPIAGSGGDPEAAGDSPDSRRGRPGCLMSWGTLAVGVRIAVVLALWGDHLRNDDGTGLHECSLDAKFCGLRRGAERGGQRLCAVSGADGDEKRNRRARSRLCNPTLPPGRSRCSRRRLDSLSGKRLGHRMNLRLRKAVPSPSNG